MIFNRTQINSLLSILKKHQFIFIARQLGLDFLSKSEKDILTASGVNLFDFKDKKGVIEHSFLFGILAEAIGDERAKKMDYKQFKDFLKSGKFIPLNEEEEYALDNVKNRAYTDITNLADRMKNSLSNLVLKNNQKSSLIAQKIIRKKAIKSIELRLGARSLASDLAEVSKNWESDWLRVAYYLTHESFNTGKSRSILRSHGENAEVYFDVYKDACKHCKKLYLKNPEDENSEPIIFKLKEIIENGNNIGRKVKDWLPTISPIHPYCRCTINYKRKGFKWDSDLRAFSIPIKKKSSKLKNTKLNIKVSK